MYWYLVVSRPNAEEVTFNECPRLLTADPKSAVRVAREIFESENEKPFLASVFIYRVQSEVQYPMDASRGFEDRPSPIVVYLRNARWGTSEKFWHGFDVEVS